MDASLLDEIATAAIAASPPREGARVLDVEAGLGALTLRLARAVGKGRVDALDGSKAIVAALKARLAVKKVVNVEPRVGDADALPFIERTFDAAYWINAGSDAARGAVLVEMRRVLKPGAPAAVAANDAGERQEIVDEMEVAGFDELATHAVKGTAAFIVVGIA
jgi:ubiquinone/menaquinone biosynthesis C-methylase UbiE